MTFRPITQEQARQVLCILVEECGYRVGPPDGDAFVRKITTPSDQDQWKVCREYRFCGALGYGGKFYNNGNNGNTPYVGCYPEDETPARIVMIDAANRRIIELFRSDA